MNRSRNSTFEYSDLPCNYHCELCEVEFNDSKSFENHLSQHETCGIDGCQFIASPEQLKTHILYLHSSGLYNRIQSGYSKEEILKWKADRQKNYPNSEKSTAAAEKRSKLRDLKHQRYLARAQKRKAQEEEASAKRRATNEFNRAKKKRKQNKRPKEFESQEKRLQKFKFSFPEGDMDEEDDKNGSVVMFCGTRSYLQSLLPPETITSVDDEEEDDRPDFDISDEDEWQAEKVRVEDKVLTKNLEVEKAPSKKEVQVSKMEPEVYGESDDDDPLEIPISKQDTYQEKSKPLPLSKNIPKVEQTQPKVISTQKSMEQPTQRAKNVQRPKPERSSFRLVQKSYRNPTLLERLLEKDVSFERSQILQCVKFICDKNFFGIGQSN